MDLHTLTARWVFPVDGPPLPGGTVTIAGERIVAVEPHGQRAADVDLGNVALLPGFVNAHTHLDLSGLRGLTPPSPDFTGWLRQVVQFRRITTSEEVDQQIAAGIAESLRFGTTLVGDIASEGKSWQQLAAAPLCATVYRELLGLTEERAAAAWEGLYWWMTGLSATSRCKPGISPHAPYSVRSSLFFGAATLGSPVALHLGETQAELDLLADRRGPFVPFLKELGVWDPEGLADGPDHILRLLNGTAPIAIAHGNYLRADAPIPSNAAIVYCPRTHAAFGHPPHPFRDFLARGVRVALGTDSLASNPDLSVLAEARFLHGLYPDFPGATLLRMATLSGAEALGWADVTGSLTPGKSADLVVVPLPDQDFSDPHALILATSLPVQAVMVRGQWVWDGERGALAPRGGETSGG
jgi:cytosine/adenosine deaminase-related metal-dependent hydrolase